jgi:predicted aldo/keto reductase-like oxidoreductase
MGRGEDKMDKIRLGKTGMTVSRLGFGGIPIQRVSEDEAVAVVQKCLDLGITFFDTANAYTTSEARIGKAIKGRRGEVVIATKSTSRSCEGVEGHLNMSLEHLGLDYIDLYQFHQVGDFKSLEIVLDPKGPMVVLEKAKKAGVIKHIGITSHQIDVAKEAVKSDRFETLVFPFNFIACEAADELLPLCRKHDVGFIAMKPLAGGALDNVSIAFKYLFQFPDVLPIPGIEKPHEIEEIVEVLQGSWDISETEQREMQRLRDELGNKFCRRCDYCQPCAQEIPISSVMVIKSAIRRLPPERLFTGIFADAVEKAANCTECGDCEERCPFHLPIREMLRESTQCFQAARQKYDGSEGA